LAWVWGHLKKIFIIMKSISMLDILLKSYYQLNWQSNWESNFLIVFSNEKLG
jgi:hypothetical protein